MSPSVLNQMILLFAYIIAGYLCFKIGIFDEWMNDKLGAFLLKVTVPASIVCSAFREYDMETSAVIGSVGASVIMFIVVPVLAFLFAKLFRKNATYQMLLIYSNQCFMGIPLISSVFGSEAAVYGSVFLIVFNLHIFSYGQILLSGGTGDIRTLGKRLCTPGVISAVAAFFIVMLHIPAPQTVTDILGGIGSISTPLAMMFIGSQLATVNVLETLKRKDLYVMSFLKLVLLPAIVYVIMRLGIGPGMITDITTIITGLPAGSMVSVLSAEYGGDTPLAAEGICISTVLSIITITGMLALLGV